MIFNLIKDGGKYYLCMKDTAQCFTTSSLCNNKLLDEFFFSLKKLMFSNRLTTDKKHSIIEKELVELVWTLKEGEDYSYEELIKPLLRTAKLKNIGI